MRTKNIEPLKIRHSKISNDFVGLVEIQERDWQYLIENFIARRENFNIKVEITEKESKTLKEIEINYKICRHVYNLIYKTIFENFQEYLRTLDFNELEELNSDIKRNGWGHKTIQEYDSTFELMKSFNIFNYLNGRFPYNNDLLWAPDGDKPDFILGGKISIKRLYELFRGIRSHGLVLIQFLQR